MRSTPCRLVAPLLVLAAAALVAPAPARAADERATRLAAEVLDAIGGEDGWRAARHHAWSFFGRRDWAWDTWTGRARLEQPSEEGDLLVLFDVDTREGRAWRDGTPLEGEALRDALDSAHAAWINDTYWMFMPFKLFDEGVTLERLPDRETPDGRRAHLLRLTFEDVGLTPQNAYDVFVDPDTHLVAAWSFYPEAPTSPDAEPRFTMPWAGWRWFGPVRLATDHGRGADWRIAVHEDVPDGVYDDPSAAIPLGPEAAGEDSGS